MFKDILKKMLLRAGLVVQPYRENPGFTLLGLKRLNLRSVVDVGANEGQFARLALKRVPGASLYCFEPLPQAFARLEKWGGSKPNVHLFNMALGETAGSVEMVLHSDHAASSSILSTTALSEEIYPFIKNQERVEVQIDRLDNVLGGASAPLLEPYLIKLDVQGFEGPVIRGGRSVFSGAAACIVEVGLDGLYEGQSSFKEVFGELDSLDFRYAGNLAQVYSNDGHVIYLDAVFVRCVR
jgi:FkbM family methyltransferase